MRLKNIRVTDFKSVRDSGDCEISDVTCLVGKNEAGKTAILQAMYRIHPIRPDDAKFDVTDDYPRLFVEDYRYEVEQGRRNPAIVAKATFELDDQDVCDLESDLGPGVLTDRTLLLSRGYSNRLLIGLAVDDGALLKAIGAQLSPEVQAEVAAQNSFEGLGERLDALKDELKPKAASVRALVASIIDRSSSVFLYEKYLEERTPKFLYFDEYYQLEGQVNIEALIKREADGQLTRSDLPLVALTELARLKLPDLLNPTRTEELHSRLEGAANGLTRKIIKYWSQNRHLRLRFSVDQARSADPTEMRQGTNLWARVYNSRHHVTTLLGTRSRGFVWFLSFLAWFSQQRRNEAVAPILLLDEPGLFLHAKAQGDLLRYIEEELKPEHQVVYTTHSPFMVDAEKFARARIVEDKGANNDEDEGEPIGTQVITDVLATSAESLFPLQGALGYEMTQALFVGPFCLVVEGVSDLLVLQTMSGVLARAGRVGLDPKWCITPVGGSEKVPTFVALLGAQKKLKLAALLDYATANMQTVENLYKRKLLKKKNLLTYADFVCGAEADVEDMFDEAFYLDLVNAEYGSALKQPVKPGDLTAGSPRLVVRLDDWLARNPMTGAVFTHYRAARYFCDNIATLEADLSVACKDRFEALFKAVNALR